MPSARTLLADLICLLNSATQVKPLSRLLMTTEEQDGRAQAKNDTIFYVWASVDTMSLMIATVHAGLGGGGLDGSRTIVTSNCRQ